MRILVIAEHDGKTLSASTLCTLGAAAKLGHPSDLLLIGSDISSLADQATSVTGIEKVLLADNSALEHPLAEPYAQIILSQANAYDYILAPATTFGKNILPRIAALLDVQQISEITAVIDGQTFQRPVYAGNAIATVKSTDSKKVITVRTTAFDPVPSEGGNAEIQSIDAASSSELSSYVGLEVSKSDRPDLTSASRVISGGRGLGSAENFALIEKLADKLGAAIGASRAAVDAGYVPNDYQVGQTGKVVAPELYIAIGISGAIQHLAGMKDSKTIVAINKDADAPIFQIADYGLVADLFEALPELTEKI